MMFTTKLLNQRIGLCALFLLPQLLIAQPQVLYEESKAIFPDDRSVFLENILTYHIWLEDGVLTAYAEEFTDMLILEQPRSNTFTHHISGSSLNEVSDIKALHLSPRRNRYRSSNITDMTKRFERDDNNFFDDYYNIQIDFSNVEKMSRMQVSYRRDLFNPAFISGRLMAGSRPIRHSELRVLAHKDIELRHTVFNDPDSLVTFIQEVDGDKRIYRWVQQNASSFENESNAPPLRKLYPYVGIYVSQFKNGAGFQPLLGTANDLGKVYLEFYNQKSQEPSEGMIEQVNNLLAGADTEEEKVKRVFYWVQDNIRYIAFEDGLRGLTPFAGTTVFEQRYGDCKDMSVLMVEMLKIAGIEVYPAWIGTRRIPQNYSDLPTPAVDNHMIAVYKNPAGEYIFLDATQNYTPFGLPASPILSKEALIKINPDSFAFIPVPELEAENSVVYDSVFMRLEGRSIVGSGKASMTGLQKVEFSYLLDRSNRQLVDDRLRAVFQKGSNRFTLSNAAIENIRNRDEPLRVSYDFEIRDYANTANDRLFINLNLEREFGEFNINQSRKYPIQNDFKSCSKLFIEFKIPDGYEIESIPENFSISNELSEVSLKYTVDHNQLIYHKVICENYLQIETSQFETWNEMIRAIREAFNQNTVLKKIIDE